MSARACMLACRRGAPFLSFVAASFWPRPCARGSPRLYACIMAISCGARLKLILTVYTLGFCNALPKLAVVTCYFPLGSKSKFNESNYLSWISNFMNVIDSPLIIYTTDEVAILIKSMRSVLKIDFQIYKDVWSLPPNMNMRQVYMQQWDLDPEKNRHSAELYGVWNARPWMIADSAKNNKFYAKYYVSVDIGALRSKTFVINWPNMIVIENLLPNGILLSDVSGKPIQQSFKPRPLSLGPIRGSGWAGSYDKIQGGFYIVSQKKVSTFVKKFYCLLGIYLQHGYFIGKDQDILNSLVSYGDVHILNSHGLLKCSKDVWFAFWEAFNHSSPCTPRSRFIYPRHFECSLGSRVAEFPGHDRTP